MGAGGSIDESWKTFKPEVETAFAEALAHAECELGHQQDPVTPASVLHAIANSLKEQAAGLEQRPTATSDADALEADKDESLLELPPEQQLTSVTPLDLEGDAVAKARKALVESLEANESIAEAGEDAAAAQQLKIIERAEQYALALVDAPGELPAPGTYTDVASIFAALQPKEAGKLAPVKLLRSSWILARAARLRAATCDEERRLLRLPRRQDLERDEPDAFMSPEELEALPRNEQTGSLALGASSYCWLSPQHPDPLGEQLMSLASAIERAQMKGEHGNPRDHAFPSEAAFFIGALRYPQHQSFCP